MNFHLHLDLQTNKSEYFCHYMVGHFWIVALTGRAFLGILRSVLNGFLQKSQEKDSRSSFAGKSSKFSQKICRKKCKTLSKILKKFNSPLKPLKTTSVWDSFSTPKKFNFKFPNQNFTSHPNCGLYTIPLSVRSLQISCILN